MDCLSSQRNSVNWFCQLHVSTTELPDTIQAIHFVTAAAVTDRLTQRLVANAQEKRGCVRLSKRVLSSRYQPDLAFTPWTIFDQPPRTGLRPDLSCQPVQCHVLKKNQLQQGNKPPVLNKRNSQSTSGTRSGVQCALKRW